MGFCFWTRSLTRGQQLSPVENDFEKLWRKLSIYVPPLYAAYELPPEVLGAIIGAAV